MSFLLVKGLDSRQATVAPGVFYYEAVRCNPVDAVCGLASNCWKRRCLNGRVCCSMLPCIYLSALKVTVQAVISIGTNAPTSHQRCGLLKWELIASQIVSLLFSLKDVSTMYFIFTKHFPLSVHFKQPLTQRKIIGPKNWFSALSFKEICRDSLNLFDSDVQLLCSEKDQIKYFYIKEQYSDMFLKMFYN